MNHTSPVLHPQPQGFLSLAKSVGIKDDTLDLTVIHSSVRARAAAVFTRSRFPGAPVIVGRAHISDGFAQAIVVNSKNANMATMLAYVLTDAELPPHALHPMLRRAVGRSFNAISVDTDTSTSDTVVLMANGLAGPVHRRAFEQALIEVCEYLAREIARNGEGATKLLTVRVSGARHARQAKHVAKAVVNSPLVKTAVYGCDPNWGRIVMAVGKCADERDIEPQ